MKNMNIAVIIGTIWLGFAGLLVAQTNSTDLLMLMIKKQGQEQALLGGYGKSLDSVMAELKKKGDLDSYVVVETEKKRFVAESTVPFTTNGLFAVPAETYCKSRVTLLKQYIAAIDSFIKRELAADKVDSAKEAKAEKEKVVVELADLEGQLPASPKQLTAEEIKKAKIVIILLGKWDVKNIQTKYRGIWTFQADGTVLASNSIDVGKWTIEEKRIFIKWNDTAWETFNLPLSKSISGDSGISKKGTIRATKME